MKSRPLRGTFSIFALSTFDTDYVLVKQESLEEAVATLLTAGHEEVAVHR